MLFLNIVSASEQTVHEATLMVLRLIEHGLKNKQDTKSISMQVLHEQRRFESA